MDRTCAGLGPASGVPIAGNHPHCAEGGETEHGPGSGNPAETARLAALHDIDILDTAPEAAFDDITRIAAQVCRAPIALVNFVDQARHWSKAAIGPVPRELPHHLSFCTQAIRQSGLLVVPDLAADPRFAANPLVREEPNLRFYAAAVLRTPDGLPLGTICVLDTQPRPAGLTPEQADTLAALGRSVMRELDLRRLNRDLAESEARNRALIEASAVMVWRASAGGDILAGWGWQSFSGQAPHEYENDGWLAALHPDDRERVAAEWCAIRAAAEPATLEYRARHTDGVYRWVQARGVPLKDGTGAVREWVGTITDIHDRRTADERLRESEQRYRVLVEASATVAWRAAPNGAVLGVSGWGDLPEDVGTAYLTDRWIHRVHPDDRDGAFTRWRTALSTATPLLSEYRLHHDGAYRWVQARGLPLRDADGTIREWVGTLTDIHTRKTAEEALRSNEERYRLAARATTDAIWDWDFAAGRIRWGEAAATLFGFAQEDLDDVDTRWIEDIHPDDRQRVEDSLTDVLAGREVRWSAEYRFRRRNGTYADVLDRGFVIRDDDGTALRMVGAVQDCSERKRAQDALRESEERLQIALRVGRMVAWERDLRTGHVRRSENAFGLLGIGSGANTDFIDRVHPDDRHKVELLIEGAVRDGSETIEVRYLAPGERQIWLGIRAESRMPDRLIGITFDITDRKAAEDEIWRTANQDPLTGLPNRALLQTRLEDALAEARQKETGVSLLLIDLDDFKDVNDTLGHDAGDHLLKETATRLSAMMRDCDIVARLGGDEFAVVVVEPFTLASATRLAQSIITALGQPIVYRERTLVTKASIGVASFPDHDRHPNELMKNADIALYRAKAQGRNRAIAYSPAMRAMTEHRVTVSRDVREALLKGEIIPFYQPKVSLVTGEIVGFEALARWQHESQGLLTPAAFGPALEEHELANLLGDRIVRQVVADIRDWLDRGLAFGRVAVNLSPAQFNQPLLADTVLNVLREAKIPTSSFEVEVTETVFFGRGTDYASRILSRFNEAGVKIALDDFGTGFASLTHLKQFPVDHLKIDRSFIRDLERQLDDAAIVEAVVGLGKSLGMSITAEGVETAGQAEHLRLLGCDHAQGYHYAKPMIGSRVPWFLSHWAEQPIQTVSASLAGRR